MRIATIPALAIFAVSVVTAPVYTQGRGNSQAKKTATATTTTVATTTPKVKPTAVKTTAKSTSTPKADARVAKTNAKATTKTAKATTKATTKAAKTTAKADTRVAKAETKAARKTGTTTTTASTVPVTTVVTPTTPTTTSVKNPKLEARLLAMLPQNTTIQDASQGFKNWGQFVAAVHVSNNLNIPFAELKARMTGITPGTIPGSSVQTFPMSLGQALQSFKSTAPTPDAGTWSPTRVQTEVKRAEDAANVDLQQTRDRS